MTISFILIISGGVSSFVLGLKRDRQATYNRVSDINNTFEVISTNTSVFESVRDELYNQVLNNLFYDTMYQEDKGIKNKLSNYENLVDELTRNTYEMNSLCGKNYYYPDSVANTRCKNYKSIYEQIVNYFVSDIELYNGHIDKYNQYQESLGSLYRLRKYQTNKVYIDYNGDNQMDGKEENV